MFYFNLLLIIFSFVSVIHTQSIDSTWFPESNFTYCNSHSLINVTSMSRHLDIMTDKYSFNIMGYTDTNIVSLNPQGSGMNNSCKILEIIRQITCINIVSSASYFEIRFGFETIRLPSQQLCPDLLNGCPVLEGANITIQRVNSILNTKKYEKVIRIPRPFFVFPPTIFYL